MADIYTPERGVPVRGSRLAAMYLWKGFCTGTAVADQAFPYVAVSWIEFHTTSTLALSNFF